MTDSNGPKAAVLELIKAHGPIRAKAIADRLNISEKSARSCINRLRENGEPIWRDPTTSGFWWKDDRRLGTALYEGWKRRFEQTGL
jgi:hypothetical protein